MTGRPLIVGAGPTGLAAALFLAERGIAARVVDASATPTTTSKALGVNPRTLDILSGTGVETAIMAEGLAMDVLAVHQDGRLLGEIHIDYPGMDARYPMTILPQARTEALLAEALVKRGGVVERGVGLEGFVQHEDGVIAVLRHADGRKESVEAPIMLGADGAHSVVRHGLGLDFPGSAFPEDWQLMDVELTGVPPRTGWIDFNEEGPFVVLPFDATTFRLIGFGPPLLERLPKGWGVGKVLWQSGFHVSHRIVPTMAVGRVALAGDAAHIHSPIGARGMNLGIEDAYVFAACAGRFLAGEAGALDAYGQNRREVDAAVVKRVERLTNAVRSTSKLGSTLRALAIPVLSRIKPVQRMVARQGLGLDHPLVIP
jgi:2-polyprenyl-6-methoxyphenol hydroxylase-like FAD-dependent oxidoreductase